MIELFNFWQHVCDNHNHDKINYDKINYEQCVNIIIDIIVDVTLISIFISPLIKT